MSRDAIEMVKSFSHPNVKGSRRALLEKIAELIPEGQTMTAPIDDDDLATLIRYERSTVLRARKVLIAIRAVRVIGGQGCIASYELLALPGAGAPPSLPLRADLRTVGQRSTPLLDAPVTDVLEVDDDEIRAYTVWQNARSWQAYLWQNARSWLAYLWQNARSTVFNLWQNARSTRSRAYTVWQNARSSRMDVDVDDARAGDVKDLRSTHTHTGAAEASETNAPPPISPAPFRHPHHAHCGARFCVPQFLDDQFRQQSGWSSEQLRTRYREWDTRARTERIAIPDALRWLRTQFAETIGPSVTRAPDRPARIRPDIRTTRHEWQAPDAIDKRRRQDEADAWQKARNEEAERVIASLPPLDRAALETEARDELSAFSFSVRPGDYAAAEHAAMMRIVLELANAPGSREAPVRDALVDLAATLRRRKFG